MLYFAEKYNKAYDDLVQYIIDNKDKIKYITKVQDTIYFRIGFYLYECRISNILCNNLTDITVFKINYKFEELWKTDNRIRIEFKENPNQKLYFILPNLSGVVDDKPIITFEYYRPSFINLVKFKRNIKFEDNMYSIEDCELVEEIINQKVDS